MTDASVAAGLLILARALQYAGGLALAATGLFRWLILAPAFAPAGDAAWNRLTPLLRRLRDIYVAAGIVLLVAAALLFWATAAGMSGTSLTKALQADTLAAVLLQTRFGTVCLVRLGLALLLAVLAWPSIRQPLARGKARIEAASTVTALALTVSVAWTGHAAATGSLTLFVADALHLLAASIWPAGLLPFALFLHHVCRNPAPSTDEARVVGRFSAISLAIVIALVFTGVINAWFLVGGLSALVDSGYGRLLCLKLLLFVLIFGIATRNRFVLVPRILNEAPKNATDSYRALCTAVVCELILATLVIAVVAVLGITPPGH